MSDETPQRPTDASRFADMAKRMEHNANSKFGGAFVIVPPEGAGEPMEALILDTTGDPAQFLMLLQAKITQVLAMIDNAQRRLGR